MDYNLKQKVAKYTRNKYEAVIVASKLARKINNQRLSAVENLGADEPVPVYKDKVTTEALNELADGKVKFEFKKEEHREEEELFPE